MSQGSKPPQMKEVYVVRASAPELDRLQKKEKTETKRLYILKDSDEVVVKYSDVVHEFVTEDRGVYYVIGQDKPFLKNLSNALVRELEINPKALRQADSIPQAGKEIKALVEGGGRVFIFLEADLGGDASLKYLTYVKENMTVCPVVVLSYEFRQETLARLIEAGADNSITKPASVNTLVEKIAFTLMPQTELVALVRQGRRELEDNDFEGALETARKVLDRKPNSAAGFMILGDALKGLKRLEEALRAYQAAEESAELYMDPLKRILEFYEETEDDFGRIIYLDKLDKLSPHDLDRKLELAGLLVKQGRAEEAEGVIDAAIKLAGGKRGGEIGMDFAERLMAIDPVLSEKYFRGTIDGAKRSRGGAVKPLMFNRLGLALRRQGRWRDAVTEYEKAEAMVPRDENIQFNMAMALAEGKQWSSAADRLERALELNPAFHEGNAIVSYHVGTILRMARRSRKALDFYRHVMEIDSNYKDTRQILASLELQYPDA